MVDIINYAKQFLPAETTIMPYSRSHYYMMRLNKYQTALQKNVPNYLDFFDFQAASGPNFTVLKKGIPMASAGFVPLWPGVFEGWMLRDERISPHGIPAALVSKRIFSGLRSIMELHRVQFHVHSLDTRAIKYAKFLMFKEEGLMEHYAPDKSNYVLMRRLY